MDDRGDPMDIPAIKETNSARRISIRRIIFLCNEGGIVSAQKAAGVWLLPKDAERATDDGVKTGKYKNWRNKTDMSSNNFENNLKNLKGTFAVEGMTVSEDGIKNLKRIDSGKVSYTEVIEEIKHKYMQRV